MIKRSLPGSPGSNQHPQRGPSRHSVSSSHRRDCRPDGGRHSSPRARLALLCPREGRALRGTLWRRSCSAEDKERIKHKIQIKVKCLKYQIYLHFLSPSLPALWPLSGWESDPSRSCWQGSGSTGGTTGRGPSPHCTLWLPPSTWSLQADPIGPPLGASGPASRLNTARNTEAAWQRVCQQGYFSLQLELQFTG